MNMQLGLLWRLIYLKHLTATLNVLQVLTDRRRRCSCVEDGVKEQALKSPSIYQIRKTVYKLQEVDAVQ